MLFLLLPGPLILFMLIRGVRWAARAGPGREYSWLLVAAAAIVAMITVAGGKPYYSAPLVVPFFTLGAVATERESSAVRGGGQHRHAHRRIRDRRGIILAAVLSAGVRVGAAFVLEGTDGNLRLAAISRDQVRAARPRPTAVRSRST